jgi:phosphate transport system permease protein
VERTAAGILVLLSLLISLNAAAVFLRQRFERRW